MKHIERYEFDNTKMNFRKKNSNSSWNFYVPEAFGFDFKLAIKGYELKLQDKIIVNGSESENEYGKTIWVQSQEVDIDSISYNICLLSQVRGISEERAEEIFEFSECKNISELYEYLKRNKISGVGKSKIKGIEEKVKERNKDSLFLRLHALLDDSKKAKRISETIDSMDELYANPYKCLKSLRWGFQKIDELAREKLNISLDNVNRIHALTEQKFKEFNNKSANYVDYKEFVEYLLEEVVYLKGDIKEFMDTNELIVVDENRVYLSDIYDAEVETPGLINGFFDTGILNAKSKIEKLENLNNIELSDEQRDALISIVKSDRLSILTGEAGTGKSTITKFLCDLLAEKYSLALLSPTGKASARMRDCTGRSAHTIHSLMYALERGSSVVRENYGIKNEFVLIIDEFSMVCQELFYELLDAINNCSFLDMVGIVVIGDEYQLPSVGSGQVLVDMINSKCFNHVHLTKTFRQKEDSNIIKNAKKVRNKKNIDIIKEKDFCVLKGDGGKAISIYNKLKERYELNDFYKNVQIVTATNKTKDMINDFLKVKHDTKYKFVAGDKVINKKNNKSLGLANGDFGVVSSVNKECTHIYFFDIQQMLVFENNDLGDLDFAYACTTHKLQGSEYKTVIIVLENNIMISNYRSFYTAITRGKENVVVVAKSESDIRQVCTRDYDYRRKTYFCERLKMFKI